MTTHELTAAPRRRRLASILSVPVIAASLVLGTGSLALAEPIEPTPTTEPDASIAAAAVGDATIVVRVGGDRAGVSTTGPLAGVSLHLWDGTAAGPTVLGTDSWRDCVSDADGNCTFLVPSTEEGGVNRDRILWVAQTGTADGFTVNDTLATRIDDPTATSSPYVFRVGNAGQDFQIRSGATYVSGTDFMRDLRTTRFEASGGVWQNSRVNPSMPETCGIDVALLIDLSDSVNEDLPALRDAAKGFVSSLQGTPSEVGIYTAATLAPAYAGANYDKTSVADAAGADALRSHIDTFTEGDGSTNWDAGLAQIPAGYDAAVVLTDGNPTAFGQGEGSLGKTRFIEVEKGIFAANALKSAGTSVIAFGVGGGVSGPADNLEAISGPDEGVDYYQTTDYAEAGAELRRIALENCVGTLSVVKKVVDAGTTGEDITGATPAGGWEFTAATTTAGVSPASQVGTTEAETGAVNFPLGYSEGAEDATVSVTETARDGYSIVTQGGDRAVCTSVATGEPVDVTNSDTSALGFVVDVPVLEPVSCIVYNRPTVAPVVDLALTKTHVLSGGTTVQSGSGSAIFYSLTVTNEGATTSGVRVKDPMPAGLTIVESTITGNLGWTFTVVDDTLWASYDGEFAAGATAGVTFTAVVGNVSGSSIVNVACVTATETDVNPSNDCATDTVAVRASTIIPVTPTTPSAQTPPRGLANTGFDGTGMLTAGGIMLALGLGIGALTLRRSRQHS